jgi:hypothetical protein
VHINACGYHFANKGDSLHSDIKKIAIPFFINKTFEPRVEIFITDAFVDEFLKRGKIRIVKSEDADATILGKIKSFKTYPISFDDIDRVLEYRATVVLDITLKRNDTGQIIWESFGIKDEQEYAVSSNRTTTYFNKKEAIKKIAKDMAEDIHNSIFEDF